MTLDVILLSLPPECWNHMRGPPPAFYGTGDEPRALWTLGKQSAFYAACPARVFRILKERAAPCLPGACLPHCHYSGSQSLGHFPVVLVTLCSQCLPNTSNTFPKFHTLHIQTIKGPIEINVKVPQSHSVS